MLPQKLSSHEIYSYLASKNFNLSSQKIFRQHNPNPDTIWSILTFLCQPFNNQMYEQIQPILVYLLEPEIYQTALKKIKEYITVSVVLNKTQANRTDSTHEYPFKQILKPERDSIIEKISALISLNKYVEKVNTQLQQKVFEEKMLMKASRDYRRRLQQRQSEIDQVKSIKARQKEYCEEKIKSIEAINKQISYKKKQKLDLLNSQQELNNELNKKKKIFDEGLYANDDSMLQIKRLQRQRIQNAPKLKKDRMSIIQEYQRYREATKQRQRYQNEHIQYTAQKIQQIKKIKSEIPSFVIQQVYSKLCGHKQNLSRLQSMVETCQSSKMHKMQQKVNLLSKIQSLEKQSKRLKQLKDQIDSNCHKTKEINEKLSQEVRKYQGILSSIREKINIQKQHEDELRQRFKRKKKIFQGSVDEKKLMLQALQKQAKHIINLAFEEFTQ